MSLAYKAQAALLSCAFAVLGIMPPRMASRLGAFILSALSPLLAKQNKKIDQHLALFLSDKTVEERSEIRRNLWRHLGMVMGEYPHLEKALDGHPDFKWTVIGQENLAPEAGKTALYASAHIGNWEILPVMTARLGQPFHPVFRPPNNRDAADLLAKARSANGRLATGFPKGRAGLRDIADTLRKGENVGMLVDQRHSGGIPIPFFGRMVDATSAPADLARKYGATLIPGRIIRNGPCDFTLEILPPLNTDGDSQDIMTELYALFENWIRQYPEQWLWMHRRWGKKL